MLLPLKAIIGKKPRKNGMSVIYFQYCFSSTNRVLLNTEIAIPKGAWNAKRQCVSKLLPEEIGDHVQLNEELDRIKKIIEAIISHGQKNGEESLGAYVKDLFTPAFKIETLSTTPVFIPLKKTQADFFGEIEKYITTKSKKVCEKGQANFRTMRDRLLAFQEYRKKNISFSDLDFSFYTDLVEYLSYEYPLKRKKKPVYGLKMATIGTSIKHLRMFIKDRVRRKIIPAIDMEDFKILDEEADAIYLTYDEIGRMYALDLSHDKVMELYRDMFVLGCLTALRYSDYSSLSWSDLRNDLLFKKTNKMNDWVVIPMKSEAHLIMERHYKEMIPKVSNPVLNRYIKEVAEMAGISDLITFSYKKGSKTVSQTKPKSQWVTSHTARRSFATNEYLKGTPVNLIMKITGHKTYKNFFKYIRIGQEEAALKMKEIWLARDGMTAFPLGKIA